MNKGTKFLYFFFNNVGQKRVNASLKFEYEWGRGVAGWCGARWVGCRLINAFPSFFPLQYSIGGLIFLELV